MFSPEEKLCYSKKAIKIQKKERSTILNKCLKEISTNNYLKTMKAVKKDKMKMNFWHKIGKYIKSICDRIILLNNKYKN